MSELTNGQISYGSSRSVFASQKYLAFLSLFLLFIIFIGPLASKAEVDQTKIGVKDGDSFVFIVSKFYESTDTPNPGYLLFYDSSSLTGVVAKEGEEFTITFNDVTLFTQFVDKADPDLSIKYEISYGDYTSTKSSYLRAIGGGFVVSTDWDGHRTNLEEELDNTDTSDDFEEFSVDIIDTEYEFGLKFDLVITFDSKEAIISKTTISREIRYEKATGVFTYEHNYSERTVSDTIIEQESIIKRKGFTTPELNISAFSVPLLLTTFVFIALVRIMARSRRTSIRQEE
ncbi:MAG: hypothetical protein GPJ54_21285 [Candidatus Heimdallarchaeota archaeon]|nr:hypothetical protein [Candidatus Heimdallarchaeota archaeon]